MVQDRVNEHLLVCKPSNNRSEQGLIMGQQNELSTHSQLEPQYALHGIAQSAAETPASPPIAADRLYQLAALTAGVIFLATLL